MKKNRVIGEYIITVKEGTTEEFLIKYFSSLEVSNVKKIHDNIFLIKLGIDPGPEKIRSDYLDNERIIDIQPNYEYQLERSKRKKISPDNG